METEPVISPETMLVPCSVGWWEPKKKKVFLSAEDCICVYVMIIIGGYKKQLGRRGEKETSVIELDPRDLESMVGQSLGSAPPMAPEVILGRRLGT